MIEINAILDKNEKLDAIVVAFSNKTINLIDNSNKEENNLINIDNYATKEINIDINATKEIILETAEERACSAI